MFKPMAETVILALVASIILSLTFVPAAISAFMSGKVTEKQSIIMRAFKAAYKPLLIGCFKYRSIVTGLSFLLVVGSLFLAINMGGEFIPSLDEGDIALHALRIPSTSLTQSVKMQKRVEKRVSSFPEVAQVFSKIGTAEVATDPMPPNVADTFIILKPKNKWPNPKKNKKDLIVEMQDRVLKM